MSELEKGANDIRDGLITRFKDIQADMTNTIENLVSATRASAENPSNLTTKAVEQA